MQVSTVSDSRGDAVSSSGRAAWRQFLPGMRVVVRRVIAADAVGSARKYSDVIGIVISVTDAGVVLRKDAAGYSDDAAVTISAPEIFTVKQIPPRPRRARGLFSG